MKNNCYVQQLSETAVDEYISFDHTFKMASNTSWYWRADGKWVSQYDSNFFEQGQVVTWCFTRGTSFEQFNPQLEQLQQRLTWKKLLLITVAKALFQNQTSFWSGNKGYTWPFPCKSYRVIKTPPKWHSQCIADSCNVFREDDDLGEKRSKSILSIGSMFKKYAVVY